ncbi:hypothetical protein [Amycolatopsis sp. NPDC059657]|uniref:hypothetical protein n=1 Tax=Amycolatopsis sp. NPDC059657 TaxID=3346899 RepID=UPI0036716E76
MRLHGTWSEQNIHPGAPEFGTVTFSPDGTGWLLWESWSSSFDVQRFTWRVIGPAMLRIHFNRYLFGSWSIDAAKKITYTVETDEPEDRTLIPRFKITDRLEFDRELSPGTVGSLFEREDDAQDPTT